MGTLIIYLDEDRKNKHIVHPTSSFANCDKKEGKIPQMSDWIELAKSIYGDGYYKLEVINS